MLLPHRFYQVADDHQGRTYCPNCGKPVSAGAGFCGNCGYKLNQTTAATAAPESVTPAGSGQPETRRADRQPGANGQPHQSMPRWAWITIIVIIVVLGGAYAFGRNYYAPSNQLNRDISAIKSGQKGVYQQFTSSDPSLKLSDKTIQPLLDRFKSNKQSLAQFESQLRSQSFTNNGLFEFKQTGKAWLLFDKYQIKVKPVYANLNTNHAGVKLSVNGKQVGTSNSSEYSHKFGPYVPGEYTLAANGTVAGHNLKNSNTYYLGQNNQTYDLSLKTISFNVVGTPGTVVYLNNQSQGTIGDDGSLAIKDAAWSSDLELTGKYPVNKTMITSKATRISDGDADSDVTIDFPGVMTKSDAEDYIDGLFSAISSYTDTGDLDDATDSDDTSLDDYFVDGTANTDYQQFITMAKGYYKNDDVLSVDYTPDVLSTVPAADDQSQITYDVKYDFENSEDERIQVFRYTATVKKSDDDYKIVKISAAQKIRSYTNTNDDDDDD